MASYIESQAAESAAAALGGAALFARRSMGKMRWSKCNPILVNAGLIFCKISRFSQTRQQFVAETDGSDPLGPASPQNYSHTSVPRTQRRGRLELLDAFFASKLRSFGWVSDLFASVAKRVCGSFAFDLQENADGMAWTQLPESCSDLRIVKSSLKESVKEC